MAVAMITIRNGTALHRQIHRCGPASTMSSDMYTFNMVLRPIFMDVPGVKDLIAVQALDDLNKIAAAFIALQRSVQRSSFEAVILVAPDASHDKNDMHVVESQLQPQPNYKCTTRHCAHCVKWQFCILSQPASACMLRASRSHRMQKRLSCGLWRRLRRP